MTFAGRVEARINVPTSVTVSATNSGGGPTAVTATAGSYWLSGGGGTTGLLAMFAAQLNATRAPTAGSWTTTLSTGASGTGKVTIDCDHTTAAIPSFSLVWTNTTLRDLLGFTRDIDYAGSAANIAADLGMGAPSAGYLCNEASGNLASAFGTPATLTAANSPTYSNQGPRGGGDKAIGFAATSNFDGGNVFDITGTDDLIVAWVGYLSGAAANFSTLFSKVAAAFGSGWAIYTSDGKNYTIASGNGPAFGSGTIDASTIYNEWHVGIGVIDRSTGKMRLGMRGLTTGTAIVSTEGSITGSMTTAATFRVGASAWTSQAATTFKCAAFYVGSGAGVATGLSANLSTALSNFAATFGAWTGTKQARGQWRPDCPLSGLDAAVAPIVTDLRTTQSPTGVIIGNVGNQFYRRKPAVWSHVPLAQYRESAATIANASWEKFLQDTQFGSGGTTWFSVSSALQIYDHNGLLVGSDLNSGAGPAGGWQMTGVPSTEAPQSIADNSRFWHIEIPAIISNG